MAKVFIEETTLSAIGDAIREKTGKTELIDPALMSTEIASIEAGSGGADLPEEAFNLSGSFQYRFANGGWDWFITTYGNKVTTKDITSLAYAFDSSKVEKIPFVLNVVDAYIYGSAFRNMYQLKECPKIRGTYLTTYMTSADYQVFTSNYRLRDAEDLFEEAAIIPFQDVKITSAYSVPKPTTFSDCFSLRRVPSWWYYFRLNEASTAAPYYGYSLYQTPFNRCFTLDEITNVPVWKCVAPFTDNCFSYFCRETTRLKELTFETDNGQPIVANWKSQVIDLTTSGTTSGALSSYVSNFIGYNSGITADKEVKDDATYQALKDDPDWFTIYAAYSRYNHDSAVNTINSLPDTSAYLASAGGTNTIKFKGAAGSKTDGGAINTLTAEEIAVAAAKGWTVTLV